MASVVPSWPLFVMRAFGMKGGQLGGFRMTNRVSKNFRRAPFSVSCGDGWVENDAASVSERRRSTKYFLLKILLPAQSLWGIIFGCISPFVRNCVALLSFSGFVSSAWHSDTFITHFDTLEAKISETLVYCCWGNQPGFKRLQLLFRDTLVFLLSIRINETIFVCLCGT